MLGELYRPRGLALETAQAVLEIEDPFAVNVALGCTNACAYCYVPSFMRKDREACRKIRHPKRPPVALVGAQLKKQMAKGVSPPHGVFTSFLTDPFLPQTRSYTEPLIFFLRNHGIRVATSSKMGCSVFKQHREVRSGMTIVSIDDGFWKQYEPNALHPKKRIEELADILPFQGYPWVSMEPYPVSAIWKQDLTALLEELKFVDLLIFGKWNYDKRANTEQAREEYIEYVATVLDFCKSNNIRSHIKSDTLKFCGAEGMEEWIKEHPYEEMLCGICGAENEGRIGHDRCKRCGHILDISPMPF